MAGRSDEETFGVDDVTIVDPSLLKRAAAAAAIGNAVEWFDFGIFSYLASARLPSGSVA